MHGAAVSLARKLMSSTEQVDMILATDMLDLSVFLALSRNRTRDIPIVLYFHENQLTYPWSPTDRDPSQQRDRHYAFINYTSALAADHVCFNSSFHREAFLSELPAFLQAFPDHREIDLIGTIEKKSRVLPLGLNLQELDQHQQELEQDSPDAPLILWNHRWEYDKDPESFFRLLMEVADEGYVFRLAVLGESFGRRPTIFDEARQGLKDQIVHWGYVEDEAAYASLLWEADILPVTARHDFFGVSVVQAMYCGAYPLLPDRLAYPEHIPEAFHGRHLYASPADLKEHLIGLLRADSIPRNPELREHVLRYDWSRLGPQYDQLWERICANH